MRISPSSGAQTDLYTHLRAGRVYARGSEVSATSGVVAEIQLYNPADSGARLIVIGAASSSGTAMQHRLSAYDTALSGLTGTGFACLRGGASGVGVIRFGTAASPSGSLIANMRMSSGTPYAWEWDYAWELPEGYGLLISGETTNAGLYARFTWIELPD